MNSDHLIFLWNLQFHKTLVVTNTETKLIKVLHTVV